MLRDDMGLSAAYPVVRAIAGLPAGTPQPASSRHATIRNGSAPGHVRDRLVELIEHEELDEARAVAGAGSLSTMPLYGRVPELRTLDLFVSVVDLGSLSKAASLHYMTQPAASTAMARLERKLGLTLLHRTPSGSTPTDAGKMVAAWARTVLDAATQLDTAVETFRSGVSSQLRISASYTVAEYVLPSWLPVFRRSWPRTAVELRVGNSAEVAEQVLGGESDLGFLEGATIPAGLTEQVVGHDELMVVVAPSHPWAGQAVTISELAATPLVERERGSGTREVVDNLLAPHRPAPPPQALLEVGSINTVKAAVLAGTGPAVLSRLAVRQELDSGVLATVSVDGTDLQRSLRAVWRSGTGLQPQGASLVENARAQNPERIGLLPCHCYATDPLPVAASDDAERLAAAP